ncbi:MAG TPA: phosphate ABC transporter substrate-binding protein PstS [Telluria sp.]|jgi:phosphate transport system substrate-binding protein
MKLVRSAAIVTLLACAVLPARAAEIKGAGSSAAQPLYTALSGIYAKKQPMTLVYEPSGSTDGFRKMRGNTVDFGATDVALTAEQRKSAKMLCFPTAISGVVPVVNIPGVEKGKLKLTGEVLADLFARKVVKWNDPKLKALNPGLALPDLAVTVIVREDGSGSTFNFTDYLSKASPEWSGSFGRNFRVVWASGVTKIKGSAGVVAELKKTSGAIAYVDYQYAVQSALVSTALKNREGKFVTAGRSSFSSALNNSAWISSGTYEEMLTDRPGNASWPITTSTFVLIPQVSENPEKTIAAIKFFTWGFIHGDGAVGKAEFVRLPDVVQGRIFGELTTVTDTAGVPLKWSLSEVLAQL